MKINLLLLMLLLITFSNPAFAKDYQNRLKNKYLVLNGASCAGLKFNAQATAAAWQNEMKWNVVVATTIQNSGVLAGLHRIFL